MVVAERARPYFEKIAWLAPIIREHADRAEREAQMPHEVANALHQTGMFRIFLPCSMGGGELTIPDSLHLIEEIAGIDASVGWNLAIGSAGPLFGQCLSRVAYEKIYRDPRAVIAGSLNPMTSQVTAVEGRWRFSGKATYASGSGHATYLVAAAVVIRDGAPQIIDGVSDVACGAVSD